MSYIITDIDGTLTTTGNTPRTDYIDYLKFEAAAGIKIIIVSARPVSRLDETRKWLNDNNVPHSEVHLNDFPGAGQGPNVGLAFKKYKYELLIKQYGLDQIDEVVDNDPDVRTMAESLGLQAETPQSAMADYLLNEAPSADAAGRLLTDQVDGSNTNAPDSAKSLSADPEQRYLIPVPVYMEDAAAKGLQFYADGLAGDGLQPETVAKARDMATGEVQHDQVAGIAAWIRRHRGDWEGVPQNSDREDPNYPGPGAVAGLLWGVETTDPDATDRVLSWADSFVASEMKEIVDMKEKETRSVPIGEFRLAEAGADGQRTFTGYASIWNSASAGLPFEEKIAPNAFKRSLSRAAAGQKIIAFLFGHDETRALATTASGRLQLTEDETGLRVEAKLDPADPDAAKVISMLTHESAAAGMSFGFQKVQDAWDGNNRTIKEANLFEVSILAAGGQTPAYPATLGLTAIRQVTAPKIGVEAEALLATLESVKAGRELSTEEVAVIDAVRSKLAPKPAGIDPSIAAALLAISAAEGDAL